MTANNTPHIIGIPAERIKKARSKKTAKLYQFPKDKIVRVHTKEGFNEELAKHKIQYALFLVDKHMKMMHNKLQAEGIDTSSDRFFADYVFFVETMKAVIYRSMNIQHDLHPLIDQYFRVRIGGEEEEAEEKEKE